MLLFTDATTNEAIAINPKNITCIFTVSEEGVNKTIINMLNGNIAVTENFLEVIGQVKAVQ